MTKRIFFIQTFLLLSILSFAQSLQITEPFRYISNSSVLASYKNQFGAWERDGAFPYALIRVRLEGNAREVIAAKQILTLDLGGQGVVTHVYKDVENELLFLVPNNVKRVDMTCGMDCERRNILNLSTELQRNSVYYGSVHYVPYIEKKQTANVKRALRQFFKFRLSPPNAVVQVSMGGIDELWETKSGVAYKLLTHGAYPYKISAEGYYSQEGVISVSDQSTELIVKLDPREELMAQYGNVLSLALPTDTMSRVNSNVVDTTQYIVQPTNIEPTTTTTIVPPVVVEPVLVENTAADSLPMMTSEPVVAVVEPVVAAAEPVVAAAEPVVAVVEPDPAPTAELAPVSEPVPAPEPIASVETTQPEAVAPVVEAAPVVNRKPIQEYCVNGVCFKMIEVVGGTFMMGATPEQGTEVEADESPVHEVTLSNYYMGQTEVTQALWTAVMGQNPSHHLTDRSLPVEQVSWEDCQLFIKRLNELTGENFRLPTEAEWEFAARGGNKTKNSKFSGDNLAEKCAWFDENSEGNPHPVAKKMANTLGLYDMSGNVAEWCADAYSKYSQIKQINPIIEANNSQRVIRGGSWDDFVNFCRVSYRNYEINTERSIYIGLRLAL